MSEQWDPFKESTRKLEIINETVNTLSMYWAMPVSILIGLIIICFCIYKIIEINTLGEQMPCSKVYKKLEEFKAPKYFELKPIEEERLAPIKKNNNNF